MRIAGSEVGLGWGQVTTTCQMLAHGLDQVSRQLDKALCENISLEQIWHDSEHKELFLNRNHPEVAQRVGGK